MELKLTVPAGKVHCTLVEVDESTLVYVTIDTEPPPVLSRTSVAVTEPLGERSVYASSRVLQEGLPVAVVSVTLM